jgi:arabinogalactan oligomer/maltooligosaccharide transport system permease protein
LFLAALGLGERRVPLGLVSALLLLLALGGYGRWAFGRLAGERRETAGELAAQVKSEAEKAGVPADPSGWDVNLYRRSHRLLTAGDTVDEARLGENLRRDAGGLVRSVSVVAVIALGLLAFAGFGGAARVGSALVEHRVAYVYTLPILLAMVLLVFLPFSYSAVLSLTNSNIYNSNKPVSEIWVGLQNFKDILSDVHVVKRTAEGWVFDYHNFYWTLGFTVVWTVSNVTIGVTLGLLLALALNTRGLAFRPVYRVLLILPWAVPTYITALVFQGMFHQQFGVINQMRQLVGLDPVAWFDKPLTSFVAVLTTNSYLSFSFMMVVSLGALQSIPADLYEAARVDGASRWQQFRAITLPSLRPALVPAVILSVIWTFNQILVIYLVSGGQPAGATEILISQAYKLAFEQYRYGYAAAYSMLIFAILFFYGLFQNRMTRATEAISE